MGPEPHGLGAHNTGTVKDAFTADETIALLERFDGQETDEPWLTVCSFLNPHDDSLFGVIALAQGLRYHPWRCPTSLGHRRTRNTCRPSHPASRATSTRGKDRRASAVDRDPPEVLLPGAGRGRRAAHSRARRLRASKAHENTIVIFTSDHLQGAHGGMHEKWHCAYDEALRVPFVSSPLLPGGARELDIPTNHADLIPTLLGLAGVDQDQALARLKADHLDAHALVGPDRALSRRAARISATRERLTSCDAWAVLVSNQ